MTETELKEMKNQIVVLQRKMNILVSILKCLFPLFKKFLSKENSVMIETALGEVGK